MIQNMGRNSEISVTTFAQSNMRAELPGGLGGRGSVRLNTRTLIPGLYGSVIAVDVNYVNVRLLGRYVERGMTAHPRSIT